MRAGKNTGDPTITGGTFLNGNSEKSDVSMYLAANRGQNSDGSVGELSPENAEAMVGTDYYATLIGALNAAENGQTVALVQDELTITDQITIGDGKNITFDLAGKVLNIIQPILVEGSLTLEDSTATTPLLSVRTMRLLLMCPVKFIIHLIRERPTQSLLKSETAEHLH